MIDISKYEQHNKEPFAACENPNVPKGKWLLKHIPEKPKKLLDVGCGTGVHTKWFNEQGIEATGITINKEEIKEKVHINVQFGDMLDIKFRDKTFDCVFCLGTLEHTHAPFIALCEFNRVLKNGGYLFIDMCGIGNTYILDKRFGYHKSVLFPIQSKDLLLRTNFDLIIGNYTEEINEKGYYSSGNSRFLSRKVNDIEL